MEGKNQLIVNEVNSNLALYLAFIVFGILFAIAGEYNYGKYSGGFAQGISWAIIIIFFGLFVYLYRRTKAFILAMRKNISLEEAQEIYAEKRALAAERPGAKSSLSGIWLFWDALVFAVSIFPLGFFFVYMILVTLFDYIKGNSKPADNL